VPCPPDRIELMTEALDPQNGWLRGTKHVVISNHPWPPLGIRGISELQLKNPNYFNSTTIVGEQTQETMETKRRRRMRSHKVHNKKNTTLGFIKSIMIAGVLMANDTHYVGDDGLDNGYKWIIGADDDSYVVLSQIHTYLKSLDHKIPLYLGVPGPANIGRWYCRNQSDEYGGETFNRGPLCCLETDKPCRVNNVKFAPADMSIPFESLRYDFKTELPGDVEEDVTLGGGKDHGPLSNLGKLPASALVIRPQKCYPDTCCGVGKRKYEVLSGDIDNLIENGRVIQTEMFDSRKGIEFASRLHWPAGHYSYGGGGYILSRGLLEATSRDIWDICLVATRACHHVPADVALSTCVFNNGYTVTAAPPEVLPPTSGERKGAVLKIDLDVPVFFFLFFFFFFFFFCSAIFFAYM
jgi:hypothetical protein